MRMRTWTRMMTMMTMSDEEVVLPEGELDPAVLSTLPPSMQVWAGWTTRLCMSCRNQMMCMCRSFVSEITSVMQLDLMAKIRDNKIYENRARFQKHSAQPLNFSSFQIQEYLKASAFRWACFAALVPAEVFGHASIMLEPFLPVMSTDETF